MRKAKSDAPSSSATAAFDMLPILCGAVLVTQVLSARVLNGLEIRATQWETLTQRLAQWNAWLACAESHADNRTRCHLSALTKLLGAVLAQHREGDDAAVDDWKALQPFLQAADGYLQMFPARRRKASTRYPTVPAGSQHPHP
ncbi:MULTISPECIES: hypothetical protein [Paraburkholderia]|uniref:Uncharacterized protein n=1 Tax=Paraburkholderia madseniana TaxID=2599607 RepID=A0AAP5BL15_9BURK|nr:MULTISPECIES: hypothetical protein [Paraburkholderia]MCX4150996.1 hypothetical protein [Paraburkholderia madseniana]MCX4176636.1 hypothetical protein [Paraburkholderia madseniana]MDN7153929.1 hypothetical protein [Paraburkholderia sp. WS6]MDQ6412811.1 hypothetical protein [Paraburkholderia madseniana]MDQ6464628.1 hypothetical protein [Paraburkholderia madseniana]